MIDLSLLAEHLRFLRQESDIRQVLADNALTVRQLRQLAAHLGGCGAIYKMNKGTLTERIIRRAIAHRQARNVFEGVTLK
jgi:ribosomal protein L10